MKKALAKVILLSLLGVGLLNLQVANAEDVRPTDSNLEQTVEHDEALVKDVKEIENGHIDIGPRIIDNKLGLFLRDDSSSPSVWRYLDKTVLRLNDKSKKKLPEKEEFAFIKGAAGGYVYVSPQIQKEGVLWAGWNTQSPEIVDNFSKGATLRLLNVQGPGQMTMFLESGTFGPPTVLWDSANSKGQDIWMDLNTHTHANWVFTKPGVYLVNLELSAQMKDGSVQKVVETLRFAVGSETNADQALKMKAHPNKNNLSKQVQEKVVRNATEDEKIDTLMPIIYGGIGIIVFGLMLVTFVVIRNKKHKKAAYEEIENM
ncbi:choice-of-anchor M domain-containing protein [Actinomyces sp. zg-332]|uniref:choice-of-anchor M domain-containing protein n=1 Tax=Actinomyces sp. zg-332 TaxID=2708340 RepID=UPI0014214409|nr:choice-of-anchor M domain-containing protein [Actinomyces sp. zg-332]QPK93804.1 choice-of-anchor M domain-containing protein [Actinomyces sp. zg-332]